MKSLHSLCVSTFAAVLVLSAAFAFAQDAAPAASSADAAAPLGPIPSLNQKVAPVLTPNLPKGTQLYNIRDFGATGDGVTIDSDAINRAIDAAAANGGGTVYFPAGYYLCFSIHLKTNVTLYLDQGSWIVADETPPEIAALQPRGGRGGFGGPGGGRGAGAGRGPTSPPALDRSGQPVDTTSITGTPAAPTASASTDATTAAPATDAAAAANPAATDTGTPPVNPDFGAPAPPNAKANFLARVPAGTKMYDLIEDNMWTGLRQWNRPADAGVNATPAAIDQADPNSLAMQYQDFGHSFWHNALIWGENITNVAIIGPGTIYGRGLSRGDGPTSFGTGDKSISLVNCRNVILKDFSVLQGGWFCLLATGVDNFTIDNVKVDTNRDGFDIDCCKNGHITNCFVNSPQDDGIVLKSSYALGYPRSTDDITISNCQVSGYNMGSFLDGTYVPYGGRNDGGGSGTGRIKFGTESNGGFRNISISNCVFTNCRGLAFESVDGAVIEDITVDNIAMRNIVNSPIYIRLGERLRGPDATTTVGVIRNINISNIVVTNATNASSIIIAGTTGHPIENVHLSNIRIEYQGNGGKELAQIVPPEDEIQGGRVTYYPEPGFLGTMPAYGLFARHVNGLSLDHISLGYAYPDFRPPVILNDVSNVSFEHFDAQHEPGIPLFMAWNVNNFSTESTPGIGNISIANITEASLPSGVPVKIDSTTPSAPAASN